MANIPKSGIGIQVAKDGSKIPYLMFVNGCLIFYKAKRTIARSIKTILENYFNVLGQLVDFHKFMVQFSKRIDNREKRDIIDIL